MPAIAQHAPDLNTDNNNRVLHVARHIRTQDGNVGSPKESPLLVSSSIIELQFPLEAVELVILDTSSDLRMSEDSTMGRYAVIPANTGLAIQCSDGSSVYLRRDGGVDATVQFYFHAL